MNRLGDFRIVVASGSSEFLLLHEIGHWMQVYRTGYVFFDAGYRRDYSSGSDVEFQTDQFAFFYYSLCLDMHKCI